MTLQHSTSTTYLSQWHQPWAELPQGPHLPYILSLKEMNVFLDHLKEIPIAKYPVLNPSLISGGSSMPALELTSFSTI